MGIDWYLLLPLVPAALLAILITGPGMWSDRTGYWWIRKGAGKDHRPQTR